MDQSHEGILGRSQIEFNTGCWLWTGTLLQNGYNGEAARAVGRDYGVSKSLINALRRGEIWKHLGGISA